MHTAYINFNITLTIYSICVIFVLPYLFYFIYQQNGFLNSKYIFNNQPLKVWHVENFMNDGLYGFAELPVGQIAY